MSEYRVTWEMVLEADDAFEAAVKALEIHRDPSSIATVFRAQRHDGSMTAVEVDLSEGTMTGVELEA